MAKKYDWFDISNEKREEWEKLCPVNEFRIVKPNQVPSIIPESLVEKFDSVLIVSSASTAGQVAYYMANGNRVDFKAGEIDQMPFGLAFVGASAIPSGALIQHGDWANRSTKPPPDFWTHVSESGIGRCYPLSELPSSSSGSIHELKIDSQHKAFDKIVSILKEYVDEADESSHEGGN